MFFLNTVGELRKHLEDMRDDVMLVDSNTGESCLTITEPDDYMDTETGEERLGICFGSLSIEEMMLEWLEDIDESRDPKPKPKLKLVD